MNGKICRYKLSGEKISFLRSLDFSEIEGDYEIKDGFITVLDEQYKIFTAILMEYEGMYGFKEDYEPNEYGRFIEAILDDLTRQRYA